MEDANIKYYEKSSERKHENKKEKVQDNRCCNLTSN